MKSENSKQNILKKSDSSYNRRQGRRPPANFFDDDESSNHDIKKKSDSLYNRRQGRNPPDNFFDSYESSKHDISKKSEDYSDKCKNMYEYYIGYDSDELKKSMPNISTVSAELKIIYDQYSDLLETLLIVNSMNDFIYKMDKLEKDFHEKMRCIDHMIAQHLNQEI